MALESELKDSAATALALSKRDASGDSAYRRLGLAAVAGGLDNLGYERAGVYAASATFTIDNQSVNGVSYLVTTGSTNRTANLPAAASWAGLVIEVVKVDSGTGLVTIDPNGSETLNGSTTVIIYEQYECYRFRSDGTNWIIVGRYNPNEPLQQTITDPGNAGAIPVTRSGHCDLVSGGAETRTLAAPSYKGERLLLSMKTDGGDITLTCATTFNQTANNTIVFNDAGDAVSLVAKTSGSNIRWSLVHNDGCTLSTV